MTLAIFKNSKAAHLIDGGKTACGICIKGRWEDFGWHLPGHAITLEVKDPGASMCKRCLRRKTA